MLVDIEEAPANRERVVRVTGQQFAWTFAYNEGGRKFNSTQLYLPEGQSVKFDVTLAWTSSTTSGCRPSA